MKKSFLLIVCAIALVFSLSSCGGSKDSKDSEGSEGAKDYVLKPSTTKITGQLAECFKVVDKEFKCKHIDVKYSKKPQYMVSIELERIDNKECESLSYCDPFGYYGSGTYANFGFGIEIRDEDDNIVYTSPATKQPYSGDEVKAFKSLNPGETSIIRWDADLSSKDIKGTNLTFKITSAVEVAD